MVVDGQKPLEFSNTKTFSHECDGLIWSRRNSLIKSFPANRPPVIVGKLINSLPWSPVSHDVSHDSHVTHPGRDVTEPMNQPASMSGGIDFIYIDWEVKFSH